MKTGVALIADERHRQVEQEGWTPEHDDDHTQGELALAAMCYAIGHKSVQHAPVEWPWEQHWWKPSRNPIKNLAKAGALIAAEIDRLQRIER
jgi:hypothetical protein